VSALDDRRQQAREAGWDAIVDVGAREALETAIETATRVRITQEMIDAYSAESNIDDGLAAALRTAGFEVEE